MPRLTAYTWAAPEAVPGAWYALLRPEEQAELGQGRPAAECQRRLAARALLRGLLDTVMGAQAARAPIRRLASGALATDAAPGLSINVSHTRGLAAAALSREARVGIDVERLDPLLDHAGVAARFFHPQERAALASCEPSQQGAAFFALWTGKEAVAKSLGLGLERELPMRAFALVPCGTPGRQHWAVPGLGGVRGVSALRAPEGFHAALALAGPGPSDTLGTASFIPARDAH